MMLYFWVHFSVFCPQHGEQVTICLFVAMFYILKCHLPHHLLFPKPGILLFVLSRDYLEAPHASFSGPFFIAELLLSLPRLVCALAGTLVSLEKQFLDRLNCPHVLFLLQVVFPGLFISTALDVLKLSDIIFEMQYPKPARPQLEYFVQRSLEQKNYFTSYWLYVWLCSSRYNIFLI